MWDSRAVVPLVNGRSVRLGVDEYRHFGAATDRGSRQADGVAIGQSVRRADGVVLAFSGDLSAQERGRSPELLSGLRQTGAPSGRSGRHRSQSFPAPEPLRMPVLQRVAPGLI